MNTKNETLAMFGNTSRYLTFDEAFQHPLPEFDPFEQGQRLFIIRKPNFMRRLERNIIEQFSVNSYDRRYRLAKVDPHDVPKVHYNKTTGIWTSDNNVNSVWSWSRGFDSSQRKLPLKPPSSEEYETAMLDIGDVIKRDIDETYQRLIERRLNALLE